MRSTTVERLGLLLARHGRRMNARIRQALAVSGLSPRHGMTLVRLSQVGPVSQQDLIEFLAIDPSALVGLLNDLERTGLAERRRDPADRRRHIVELTATGARVVRDVDRAIAAVEADEFADLTADEIEQLRDLLTRLRARDCAEDLGGKPGC